MITFTFSPNATRDVKKAFQDLSRAGQRATVAKAARAGAREIMLEARRLAPRSKKPRHPKGHAYKTIKYVLVDRWPDRAEYAIGPTDWGWYLALHEVGTSRFRAQPHLRPALQTKAGAATAAAADVFRQAVAEAAARAAQRARAAAKGR